MLPAGLIDEVPRPTPPRLKKKEPGAPGTDRTLQKTRLCKFFGLGHCTAGAECMFAHGNKELRPFPDFQRTRLCKVMQSDGICFDPACKYAHREEELRKMPKQLRKAKAAKIRAGAPNAGSLEASMCYAGELRDIADGSGKGESGAGDSSSRSNSSSKQSTGDADSAPLQPPATGSPPAIQGSPLPPRELRAAGSPQLNEDPRKAVAVPIEAGCAAGRLSPPPTWGTLARNRSVSVGAPWTAAGPAPSGGLVCFKPDRHRGASLGPGFAPREVHLSNRFPPPERPQQPRRLTLEDIFRQPRSADIVAAPRADAASRPSLVAALTAELKALQERGEGAAGAAKHVVPGLQRAVYEIRRLSEAIEAAESNRCRLTEQLEAERSAKRQLIEEAMIAKSRFTTLEKELGRQERWLSC